MLTRASGILLLIVLLLIVSAIRIQAVERSERLMLGEQRAHEVVSALVSASQEALAGGGSVQRVVFCCFGEEPAALYRSELARRQP